MAPTSNQIRYSPCQDRSSGRVTCASSSQRSPPCQAGWYTKENGDHQGGCQQPILGTQGPDRGRNRRRGFRRPRCGLTFPSRHGLISRKSKRTAFPCSPLIARASASRIVRSTGVLLTGSSTSPFSPDQPSQMEHDPWWAGCPPAAQASISLRGRRPRRPVPAIAGRTAYTRRQAA